MNLFLYEVNAFPRQCILSLAMTWIVYQWMMHVHAHAHTHTYPCWFARTHKHTHTTVAVVLPNLYERRQTNKSRISGRLFRRCLLLYIMTLWGNKNRVRELEYIMVILMISQQMQPENTVNTIKRNALMTSQVFYGLATHRQAISALAQVKTSFIDVQAKAPWMWSENIFSPHLLPPGSSAEHEV